MSDNGLLERVNKVLEDEGTSVAAKKTNSEILSELIIPALENSKDTLSSLYSYEPPKRAGLISKAKRLFLTRIRNITFNIVEKQSMRQQKFNELTFKAIEALQKENEELREQLDKSNK
ncbi:MAG: hypothetical protein Q9M91_08030 [Candidatus Dojkabacteria bacterium]|nr:hypothetical protein [Candidatus Dojkabacteria bacterium]MDQ7021732.1 hypothetical protein [Candidatus Dojkabacteria bacterium]